MGCIEFPIIYIMFERVDLMKISVLQPEIERGNIKKNAAIIQKLINKANGDLLILAEYALTGSLVLENNVNIQKWATESEVAKQELSIPENKRLLINSLIIKEEQIYNACTLLPTDEIIQIKTIPDRTETDSGICAGKGISIVELEDKKIIIIICSDIVEIDKISTIGADLMLFIYHFTPENHEKKLDDLVNISTERNIPIVTASLTSDKNYGHSCYVFGSTIVSLGNENGILEVII